MAESFKDLMENAGGAWDFINNFPVPDCGPVKMTDETSKELLFWSSEEEKSCPHKTFVTVSQKGIHAGFIDLRPGQYGPFDVHPNGHEVFITLEGECTAVCGNLVKDVKKGEVMFCPAGMKHRFYNFTDKFCRVFFVIGGDMM